jgi:hypothetical protein
MEMDPGKLVDSARRVRTPLAVSGLVVVVLYLVYQQVLSLPVFSQLQAVQTFQILNSVLVYVFVLAIISIMLGFVGFIATPWLKRYSNKKYSSLRIVDIGEDVTLERQLDSAISRTESVGGGAAARKADGTIGIDDVFYKAEHRHGVLDCKFMNHGTASAFVHAVEISIDEFTLDVTPILTYSLQISLEDAGPTGAYGGRGLVPLAADRSVASLTISASNSGWGPAEDLLIGIDEPLIRLLQATELSRSVPPGESRELVRFVRRTDAALPSDELAAFASREPAFRSRSLGIEIRGSSDYKDAAGNSHRDDVALSGLPAGYELHLDKRGLIAVPYYPPECCVAPSPVLYTAILDPDVRSRRYRISHGTEPGGIERFHIAVAGKKSGTYVVRLTFYVDDDRKVRSEPIRLRLEIPNSTSRWGDPRGLPDGAQFKIEDGVIRLGGMELIW